MDGLSLFTSSFFDWSSGDVGRILPFCNCSLPALQFRICKRVGTQQRNAAAAGPSFSPHPLARQEVFQRLDVFDRPYLKIISLKLSPLTDVVFIAGLLLTALGLSALPVSAAVGIFLSKIRDGYIITASVAVTVIGCLAVGFFCSTLWLYLFGGCCLFLSTLIMEAAGTAALSKVMPVQLQKGIFNAGLNPCGCAS